MTTRWLASATILATCLSAACAAPAPERTSPGREASADATRLDDLRSLPYLDFDPDRSAVAERSGVVALDSARAAPGYNLVIVRPFCLVELVDLRGRVVHHWNASPCHRWMQAELLADGSLLVVAKAPGGGGRLLKYDWDGELVWSFGERIHHDVERTSSGRLITIESRVRDLAFDGATRPIQDDELVLLDEGGHELERQSLFELFHAGPAVNPLVLVEAQARGALDLLHTNSVEWMPFEDGAGGSTLHRADHVLVSLRHQDLIAVFDWPRRRLVWSWGAGELSGPHDATWLENGNLLVFDNGLGRDRSRVVEVDPASRRIVWQYEADPPESFFTLAFGSAQRLPNGNTLAADSLSAELFEVTRDGDVVWRYRGPHEDRKGRRAALVRVKRYPPERVEPHLAGAASRSR